MCSLDSLIMSFVGESGSAQKAFNSSTRGSLLIRPNFWVAGSHTKVVLLSPVDLERKRIDAVCKSGTFLPVLNGEL